MIAPRLRTGGWVGTLLAFLMAAGAVGFGSDEKPRCRCTLQRDAGRELALSWWPRPHDPDELARVRRDGEHRRVYNELLPTVLDAELTLDARYRIGSHLIEAGRYRLAPRLDDHGGWKLQLLVEREWIGLPFPLEAGVRTADHLAFQLLPALNGGFELHFAWGPDCGVVVFHDAP